MPPFAHLLFSLPDTYEGLVEAQGIAQLNDQELLLEFQLRDGLMGILKSDVKFASIPYREMAAVRMHKGWTRTTIFIQVHHFQTLRDVPKQNNGQLELRVSRKQTEIVEQWVAFLMLKISELQPDRLGQTPQMD